MRDCLRFGQNAALSWLASSGQDKEKGTCNMWTSKWQVFLTREWNSCFTASAAGTGSVKLQSWTFKCKEGICKSNSTTGLVRCDKRGQCVCDQNMEIRTTWRMVAQREELLSHWFFFSSKAHIPRWTASNSTGFRSPYSPEATSMTEDNRDGNEMKQPMVSNLS